jgi:cytochrome c-type biogenesis protein CcmF
MQHLFLFLFLFIGLAVTLMVQQRKVRWLYIGIHLLLAVVYFTMDQASLLFSAWLLVNIGFLVFAYQKYYPKQKEDDQLSSREFWMMAGILVLIIASVQITVSTSIPVINRIFDTRFDALTNLNFRNEYYGLWQVPFAIMVLILMGVTQFLNYRKTGNLKKLGSELKLPLWLALLFTAIFSLVFSLGISEWRYILLLFAAIFAVAANASWMFRLFRVNTLQTGAALAHLGFAMLIIGALVSSVRKTPISENQEKFNLQVLDESFLNNENVLLRKGDTVKMDQYFITYRGKKREGVNIFYNIGYFEAVWDHQLKTWQQGDSLFSLNPWIQQNEQFGQVSEPDTRHYWSHDVFTHIKWADTELNDHGHEDDDFMNRIFHQVELGNTYQHDNLQINFKDIYLVDNPLEKRELGLQSNDMVIRGSFEVQDVNDPKKKELMQPVYLVKDSVQLISRPAYSELLQVELEITELSQKPNSVLLSIREKEYLVMQALLFPGMNLLWGGCLVMILGMGMVMVKRWRR